MGDLNAATTQEQPLQHCKGLQFDKKTNKHQCCLSCLCMFVIIHSFQPVYWSDASDCHTHWTMTLGGKPIYILHVRLTKGSSNTLELRSEAWRQAMLISCLGLNSDPICPASWCVHWTNLDTPRCKPTHVQLTRVNMQSTGLYMERSQSHCKSRPHQLITQIQAKGAFHVLREGSLSKYTLGEPRAHMTSELWEHKRPPSTFTSVNGDKPHVGITFGFISELKQFFLISISKPKDLQLA